MEPVPGEQPIEALSVYRACEPIQDGRHKPGVRYSVPLILTLIVLAKLAAMTTLAGIAQWVRLRGEWLNQMVPTPQESCACAATSSNVLRTLEAEQVRQGLNDLLIGVGAMKGADEHASRLGEAAEEQLAGQVALDGKTLRGTLGHEAADQQKMHQLTRYDRQTGVLLKEQVTGEKQNELSILSQLLTPVLVTGRIISADALHTQRAFCLSVTRWDGDYILIAKDNQASLADDLRLFFREPPADCRDWRTARTVEKGHGRLEIRELIASTELNAFLGGQWAGVAQVFQLTRTVYEDGQMRREVVSGITSLSPARAAAARLLALVRAQWRIENRLHWRREVTLREDACQVRTGDAPRILALLNSFLLALLDVFGGSHVPKQMRLFDAPPWLALRLLLGSLLTFK
jgi:predicted transposase YbfD/YdcC